MLFNSPEFMFLFLPAVLLAFFWLNRTRLGSAGIGWLTLASLVFYGWWNPVYVPLIVASVLANYWAGVALIRGRLGPRAKKLLLGGAILANLAVLAYYKYTGFIAANLAMATGWRIPAVDLILPLGISFFTFTQIAFLADAAQDKVRQLNLPSYALFVTYFPHLLAGPILHHAEMIPQFRERANRVLQPENFARGVALFVIGLFKKVIVADQLAVWANAGFAQPAGHELFSAWFVALSYAGQLYFDFSGYTDMAIGVSLLFNIRLPENFNSPYKARDIQDFWRRWHMTLSRFLREYVYVPLGGNRRGEFAAYRNLVLTFLVGGIWHGAGWTFIFWGALHGTAIVLHRAWKRLGFALPGPIAWLLTFTFVTCGWVLFRAKTVGDGIEILRGMLGLNGVLVSRQLARLANSVFGVRLSFGDWLPQASTNEFVFALACVMATVLLPNSAQIVAHVAPTRKSAFAIAAMLVACFLSLGQVTEFIYFQF